MNIILGSASRWRRALLKDAGFEFQAMSADIDERVFSHDDPKQFVLEIARAKAQKLLQEIREPAFLITVDQTIVCNNIYHNKPESEKEARLFLQRYSHHPAISYTGIVITDTTSRKEVSRVDIAKVYFNSIPEPVIAKAIAQGDIFHCAGAFQIEGDDTFKRYIRHVEGSLDSVQGLPIQVVKQLLSEITQ